ncbi:hypothetical protein [Prevotella melaninogenica]|uniref:Lipoprotein n=1 Tax=Prevotella melaninogenica DNF00666 TaxID=1401073 RepID=A0A096CTA9_9BACT|nr:hypothetical protein [Prevotella melaninogenica]KGF48569.1 hypothetical protein HMPREF0661_06710 [Prevotella melaninogenica DNF00666]
MTSFTFIIKRKAYALAAFVALSCVGLASCADDNLVNNNGGSKSVNPADAKLATTTVTFSADAGMQLPNVTRALDPEAPATRAVSLNERYMPLAEGSNLKARVFVVKADENSTKMINGEKAMDPKKVVMGAGEIKWDNVRELTGGGVHLYSKEDLLTLTWLENSAVIRPNEEWYICGIIGGEYDMDIKKAADQEADPATKKLYTQFYNFYVKMNPSSEHNTRDEKGRLRVTAAFSTGWTKLKVEKANVINLRKWAFKAMGTLLRFKVKRDTKLVKPEAHKYTFASSQLTANGGFMMMPLSLLRSEEGLNMEHQKGLDCEIRPWEANIDRNFYWQYDDERRLHFNNVTDTKPSEEDAGVYGAPFYEYRYTYDAAKKRGRKADKDYDEFYVWGMPVPLPNYNGTTQLTAERGSFMLGCKQPNGSKYDYADEWLYAKAVNPATESNEYKRIDFAQTRGKAFSIELGVCRPRFSAMDENKQPKYAWPNPLERLAITNSKTNERGWHDSNEQKSNEKGGVDNWTVKSSVFKMKFVLDGMPLVPDGYHVPNGEEWGCAIPNPINTIYNYQLIDKLLDWNYFSQSGATPTYELYNTGDDDTRTVITAGMKKDTGLKDKWEELHWPEYPAFYSYFMQDKAKGELYAIRFDGTHNNAEKPGGKYLLGNRYRCAYRWRLINAGGDGDAKDSYGMRLVVQSRWIGSANVGLKDIMDDAWWGKSSPDNPLFSTDCYRVLPAVGYPYSGGFRDWTWYVTYWSRTRWLYQKGYKDNSEYNKGFCYRRFSIKGFNRGHQEGGSAEYPIRLIVNRDVDEFGNNAPRKKQSYKKERELISRKADEKVTNWNWTPKNY